MNISQFLAQKIQDFVLGKVSFTPATTLYVALFTSSPDATGGGTEVSTTSTGYARVAVTNNTTNFPGATLASPSVKQNGTAITFPTATGSWGTVGWWGIFDASSGGNLYQWGQLLTPKVIGTGDSFAFVNPGDMTLQLS